MGKEETGTSWQRRIRLAGIVAAATVLATASAVVQACKSAAGNGAEKSASPAEPTRRPVTIVVEPAPKASEEPEEAASAGSVSAPAPDEPKPRRSRPADSTVIYE